MAGPLWFGLSSDAGQLENLEHGVYRRNDRVGAVEHTHGNGDDFFPGSPDDLTKRLRFHGIVGKRLERIGQLRRFRFLAAVIASSVLPT